MRTSFDVVTNKQLPSRIGYLRKMAGVKWKRLFWLHHVSSVEVVWGEVRLRNSDKV